MRRRLIVTLMLFLCCAMATAQNSFTIGDDTLHIEYCNTSAGVIYDNGGPDGDYTNNYDGWAVIHAPAGITLTLSGSYNTESCCDKITVYDGRGATGQTLVNAVGSTGTLNVQSTTGWLSIYFHTDYSSTRSGFALAFSGSGTAITCSNRVTGLAASDVTTTSATLSWLADNTAGPFNVVVNGIPQTVSANSLSLTGLNPNTRYYVQVCDATDATSLCCVATLYFRTACGTMATPIAEDFDSYGAGPNVLPACWVRVTNYDALNDQPQIVDQPTYGGSAGALRMYCGANEVQGHYGIVYSPVIGADINTLYLRMKIRGTSYGDKLEIGTASDTLNNSFVPFDTLEITSSNTWQDVLVSFDGYTGSGNRIAFRMLRRLQPGNNQNIYIDGVTILSCGVWNLVCQRRGISDMWIAWDTVGNPAVNVEYGPAGFIAGTGITQTGALSPMHVAGLQPGTAYDFNFYTSCGGGTPHAGGTLTVATLERNPMVLNYCEGFEEEGLPAGWRASAIYDGTPQTSSYETYSGSRSLRLRSPYYGNGFPVAVMPIVDTVAVDSLSLSFMTKGGSSSTLQVGVMLYPEDTSTFVPVETVPVGAVWSSATVSLASYQGTGRYIAFRASDISSSSIYIDNLQVGTCMLANLSRTNITSTSVELQWDVVNDAFHGDSVIVEYGPNGFASGTRVALPVRGEGVQVSDGRQHYVVNGLEGDSLYQFAVYGQCGVMSTTCDQFRLSARTLAENITLPYCVDFEQFDAGGYPIGWERPSMCSGTPRISNGRAHSGSRSMELYSYSSSANNHSTVVLPLMQTDNLAGKQLSLWAYKETGYPIVLEVGVMTSPSDESTFAVQDSIVLDGSDWRYYVADLSGYAGTGLYVAIRQCANYYNTVWIDDIEVGSCTVKEVRHHSEHSHGVTIAWQAGGSTYSGAVLEFGPHGFTPGSGTLDTLSATTFSVVLDTLRAGITYDYYLHALCLDQARACQFEPRTFTTFAEPNAATVCENFNSIGNYSMPDGWTRSLVDNDRPYVYDHSLRLYSNNNGSLCAMPYLEEASLSGLSLRASLYGECSGLYVLLGMMSDPADTNTFVPLDTLHAGNYSWRENTVSLASYTGAGRHLAFWMKKGQGWCQVQIDDITIERCGLSDVHAYSPTTDAVMLGWQADANTGRVELQWRRSDLPADSNTVVDSVVAPYRLQGLDPGTSYTYSLLPHCAASSRSCSNLEKSFSTMQSTLGDGWCENFENSPNYYELPAHWTKVRQYDNYYPGLNYSSYASDEGWTMRFRANSATSNMVSLPWCSDTLIHYVLSFNLRSDNEYHPEAAAFIVGVMTLPYDSASFIPIDTINPTCEYRNYTVDFSTYLGAGRHIALLYKNENSDHTVYLDELSLSRCKAANLTTSMVTNHSVRLQWDNIGYSGETLVGWRKNENENDTLQYQTSNGTSATIDNLEPSTRYTFYLWAACQDTALRCQASRIEATTLVLPMAIPYCNDFESEAADAMPAGWIKPYGNNTPRIYYYNYYAHSGNRSLFFYASNDSWNGDRTSMAVMPMLDPDSVPSVSAVVVDGWMRSTNDRLRLVVGLLTDPTDTSTFVAVDSLYVNGFLHFKVPLATYGGTGRYVAFKAVATANTSGDIYLDDVNLRTCYINRAWTHHPTQTTLDVSWEGGNAQEGVFVEYKAVSGPEGDFVAGMGQVIHASSSPFTLTGLSSATWYAVHVYPDCSGENDGCNYETSVMQTLHPAVDVPYCENFDSYSTDVFPSNWRRLSTYESSNNPSIYQYQSHSAPYSCRFRAYDTSCAFVVMPQLHMGSSCAVVDSLYLNFWTRYNWGRDYGRLVIGTMQDIYDASSFVVVDTLVDTTNDWQHHTVAIHNLNTTNTYVAFKLLNINHSSSEMYLDDLCVEKCVATDVTISDVSQSSVTITWNSNGVDSIMCEYGPQGFLAGTGTQVMMTHTPWVITGLDDGTDYQFAFAPMCGCDQYGEVYFPGGGSSGWNYWGYGWGWGYGPGGGWGWGWWYGRNWWEIPPGHPYIVPPVVDAETQAPDMVVPYCESFEDYDTLEYPSNWRRLNNATNQFPQISNSNHLSGDHCLDFYTTSGHYCFATMPSVDSGSITDMVLTFNAYSNNNYATYHHVFQVGVMTNPDDTSTFVPVDTIHLAQRYRWQSFTVDFANYTGEGRFIAFRFMPRYDGYHYYLDDLYVGRCAIENLRYSELPSGAVNVQWNNVHTPDSIIVRYGSQQATLPGAVESIQLSTSSSQLSTVYVTPYCDTTDICNPYKLDINPSMTLPYCEDFEGYPEGAYPDLMRTMQQSGNYPPVVEVQNGANMFRLSSSSGTNTVIMLPPLAAGDSLGGKWLNIRLRSSYQDNISIDVGAWPDTTDISTFVPMTNPPLRNTAPNTVEEFSVQLMGYSGPANRLAFKVNSTDYYSRIWIDRLVLSSEPYPMGIRDSEEGYATRHIYWDSGAYYTLEYHYTESDIRTAQSDSCHAVLTGLKPGKEYKVYFITPGGECSCQPYTFTTPELHSVPFCEDFQTYSNQDIPDGWRRVRAEACASNYDIRPRIGNEGNSGVYNYYLDFYHSCQQIFVMPELDVDDLSSLTFKLKVRTNDYENGFIRVGIMNHPTDSNSFVDVDTIHCSSNNDWESKIITLSSHSGDGHYIAFQSHLPDWRHFYLDNIEVYACPQPQITIAGAHAVKAQVVADSDFVADYWIEYGPQDFDQGRGVSLHVQTNPFFIEGLLSETVYDFYVRCDSAGYSCASPVRVLMPESLSIPFCENFEALGSNLPSQWLCNSYCWRQPYVTNSYGSRCLVFDGYCNQSLVLPPFENDSVRLLNMECSLRVNGYHEQQWLVVGVQTRFDDTTTFAPLDTLRLGANDEWRRFVVDFSRYEGIGNFVAFRYYNTYGSYSMYVDNLRFADYTIPSITLCGATSVSIVANGDDSCWVEYDGHWLQLTADTMYVDNLLEDTVYEFRHAATFGGSSCFAPTLITTGSRLGLTYCDNFDSYDGTDLPTGWLRYSTDGRAYPKIYNSSYYANSGAKCMEFNCNGGHSCYAVLPDMAVDTIGHIDIYFALRVDDAEDNSMVVGVCEDPYDVATFTPIDTLRNYSSSAYEWHHVSLAAYDGSGRFVTFCGVNNDSWNNNQYLDDLIVQECQHPDILLTSATTVTLSVDSVHEADYWLEYGPEGYVQGEGVAVHVTESPYYVTDLQPNSVYDFYARCDSASPGCHPVTRIRTSSTVSAPYCELFNYSGTSYARPEGWVRYHSNSSSNYPYVSGSSYLYFSASSGDICQISLPEVDSLNVSELSITFDQKNSYINEMGIVVGISTDPNNPTTFVPVDTMRNSLSGEWQQMHVSFAGYQGNGRFITLRMFNDYYYSRSMYVDNLFVETCDMPQNVRATLYSHNTVRITADTLATATGFWVEYGTTGFTQGTGSLQYCSLLPTDIILDNYSTYDFYFLCDTTTPTCRQVQTVSTTGAPIPIPYCENFDQTQTYQMPTGWKVLTSSSDVRVTTSTANTGNKKLQLSVSGSSHNYAVMPEMDVDSVGQLAVSFWLRCSNANEHGVTVGVMSDPNDGNSFMPVKSFIADENYRRQIVAFEGIDRNYRFIAFRSDAGNGSYGYVYIDDVYIDSCGVHDFMAGETESSYITFKWRQVGSPDIQIEYGPTGFTRGEGSIVVADRSPFTVAGLAPLTNYTFYFDAVCNEYADTYCNLNYHDSVSRFTPAGGTGCIDPTNLVAAYTTCFYGSYSNPYANQGAVDYGPDNIMSRHTVHHDPTATDPRTDNQLQVVPTGADASVRLGNWNYGGNGASSAQAEAITYSLFVDTNSFDLIILKYAAVLQDPDHDPTEQPRFSLELLNDSMQLLDPECGAADFIANSNLGWNTAPHNVLWKDWTTVGIDVSQYGGQTIYIRLTTRDCGEGSHYGYAYFTLGCMQKTLLSEYCGEVATNRFSAPSGFAYNWYTNLSDTTFSTAQSIEVPTNNDITYYCRCSFVDKANCYFTLSAFAGTRYPLAQMDYEVTVENCRFYVDFHNTSTISADYHGAPIGTGEGCESAWWDLGNGDTVTTYHASAVYAPGQYTVTLVSGIAGDMCKDTATLTLDLQLEAPTPVLSVPEGLCVDDTLAASVSNVVTCVWQVGDSVWSDGGGLSLPLSAVGLQDSLSFVVACLVTDSNGCSDTLRQRVAVHPVYNLQTDSAICFTALPFEWNNTSVLSTDQSSTALLRWTGSTGEGCDSTVTLLLRVSHEDSSTVSRSLVERQLPYAFYADSVVTADDFAAGDTVVRRVLTQTADGCDSTIVFFLTLLHNVSTVVDSAVCDNQLPLTWNDSLFTAAGSKSCTLTRDDGTDSTVLMRLTVYPTFLMADTAEICQGALPYSWRDTLIADTLPLSSYALHRSSAFGCDSISSLLLTVNPTTYSSRYDTVVENNLPHTFLHHTYTTDTVADTLMLTNAAGCDSVLTYSLFVHRNMTAADSLALCDNELPYLWNGVTFAAAGTQTATLAASTGADSVVTMTLLLNSTYLLHDTMVVCRDTLPLTWRDTLIADCPLPTTDYSLHRFSAAGCDSITTLNLTLHPVYLFSDTVALCEDDLPFSWRETEVAVVPPNHSLALVWSASSTEGCDSSYTLQLAVNPTTYSSRYDTVVENSLPYTFLHHTYTTDTVADTLMLTNVAGCDSVLTYSLFVHRNMTVADSLALCDNELPYVWNGVIFAAAGTQTATLVASTGADSVVTMTLLLNPTYRQNDTAEICQDALPYTWRDTLIAEQQPSTTTHSLHRSTAAGCDSIHALRLTVDSVYHTLVPVVSCQPFTWIDSVTYSEPVVVSVTLASEAGCDSVVTLQLQTPLPAETHLVDTFCAGAVYHFAGRGLTDGGLFVDSLHTEEGCDSLVYLHLTQLPLPTPTIVAEIDCGEGLYRIHAEVDVPWFEWTTTGGVWSDDWGDPQAVDLAFNPSQYRELLLVADYGESPQCPDTAHMDLYPVVTPEAVMHLSPLMTTPDNNVIEMVSESRHASIHRWYVDEVFWDEGIATSYRVPIESDSTTVMLVASGEVCSDTAVAVVPMHKVALFAPSVFTPSQGIEENRYFRIVTREVEEMEIHIYNRNGLLVFHSTDLDFRWDGTNLGGKPCPQAAYVYHLHYRDKANPGQWHTYDGTVTLLR